MNICRCASFPNLSIHDLLAEVDQVKGRCRRTDHLSIHDLLAEVDRRETWHESDVPTFNSRPPSGGRLDPSWEYLVRLILSIHDLLAEVDVATVALAKLVNVLSIHDLLAEVDRTAFKRLHARKILSIHDLLAEVDYTEPNQDLFSEAFQFTTS